MNCGPIPSAQCMMAPPLPPPLSVRCSMRASADQPYPLCSSLDANGMFVTRLRQVSNAASDKKYRLGTERRQNRAFVRHSTKNWGATWVGVMGLDTKTCSAW